MKVCEMNGIKSDDMKDTINKKKVEREIVITLTIFSFLQIIFANLGQITIELNFDIRFTVSVKTVLEFFFYFRDYNIIASFFHFLPSKFSHLSTSPYCLLKYGLLSIVVYCTYIDISIYIYIPKYNMLSLYCGTCVCIFRTICYCVIY